MPRIPATVITGFLGAGKTTVIRNILQHAHGRRIALIVNEFGDVGVDGELLAGCNDEACASSDIVELANGCICCTVADDFIPAMTALISRPERPDAIIIETSGLALPQPLIRAFNWPEVRANVTVDGVVSIVDGPALRDGLFVSDPARVEALRKADINMDHESPLHELFEDQLRAADMVILNKADLLTPSEAVELTEQLSQGVRPGVRVLPVSQGRIDPAVLLGLGAAAEDDVDNRPTHHELDGEEEHDHDDFVTFAVDLPESADKAELLEKVSGAIRDHDILRLKGFAALAGKPARLVVQATGPRVESWFDRPWKPGETRATRLVVIGVKGLDEQAVRAALA